MTSPANKWTIACGIDAHYLLDEHQQVVCDLHSIRPDHVRRIVACVNFCQQMQTDWLEKYQLIQAPPGATTLNDLPNFEGLVPVRRMSPPT